MKPGVEIAFRDGDLRHDDLREPLTSQLKIRCLKGYFETLESGSLPKDGDDGLSVCKCYCADSRLSAAAYRVLAQRLY